MRQEVRNQLVEYDFHAVWMPGKLLPAGPLPLDEVFGLLVLKLHLRADPLEPDAQGLFVDLDGHGVPDVVHLQSRPVLDGAVDTVVAQVAFLHAVRQRAEIAVRVP